MLIEVPRDCTYLCIINRIHIKWYFSSPMENPFPTIVQTEGVHETL